MRIDVRCLITISATALLMTGCGTGEYGARLQETLANGPRAAAGGGGAGGGDSLYPTPAKLDDQKRTPPGVTIRLPLLFDASANNEAGQSKVMTLPGFWYGMERVEPDSEGKPLAVYVGFGWVPKADKTPAALEKELQAALAKTLPNAAWKAGPAKSMRVLTATGPQEFKTADGAANETVPGEFRLYLIPAANDTAFVAWRGPSSDAAFWQAVEASMGTVTVEGGGEAAPAEAAAAPPA
jgi:hypothetical protein